MKILLQWLLVAETLINLAIALRNCTVRQHSKIYVCGETGTAGKDDVSHGEPFYAVSVESCRDIALAAFDPTYQDPSPFSFDTATGLCTLFYRTQFQDIVEDGSSTTYFYAPECFRCAKPSCPLPVKENLLLNSGFEDTNKISAPWFQQHIADGYSSSRAAASPIEMYQTIPLCANSIYKLSFYYKYVGRPTTIKNAFFLEYYLTYSERELDYIRIWNTNNQWIRFEELFQIPRTHIYKSNPPVLHLDSLDSDSGRLLVDDVQLSAVDSEAAVTPKPGSSSEIVNGGFESGSLEPWKFQIFPSTGSPDNGTASATAPGINSTRALHLKNPGGGRVYFYFWQIVSTSPLTQYVLQFDYILNLRGQDQRGDSLLSVTFSTGSAGHRKVSFALDNYKLIQNGPHAITIPIIADGNSLRADINILSENGEDVTIDNIRLIHVDM